MYAAPVIAHRQEQLERALAAALPGGSLQRYPAEQCHAMVRQLEPLWDVDKGLQLRPFTQDEQEFVANEQLLSKIDYAYWAERYSTINADGQTLRPMYPLFESQTIILAELARQEELRWRNQHPDGLLFNILKGRQLGASSLCQSLLAHRATTHTYVKTLIASDVPDNSGSQGLFGMLERVVEHLPWWLKPRERFHTKDKHIVFANGSSVIVESGKSMKGGLTEEGGHKGNLGRSKTYSCAHLSELSTWERPDQIDDGLMPAIPQTPRTLMARESTAKGRHNWWHDEWLIADQGLGRCFNIFVPWYAERSKYWLPVPPLWIPSDDTLAFAKRVEEKGPRYMHRAITLAPEQLVWYEQRKAEAIKKGTLYKFLEEYPAEPEEAFQFSGRSIFSPETMDRLEKQARPLLDVWTVRPHAELLEDREQLVAELKADQIKDKVLLASERLRDAARTTGDNAPQTVVEEPVEA
jgi:hypothetical protein